MLIAFEKSGFINKCRPKNASIIRVLGFSGKQRIALQQLEHYPVVLDAYFIKLYEVYGKPNIRIYATGIYLDVFTVMLSIRAKDVIKESIIRDIKSFLSPETKLEVIFCD